MNAGEVEGRAIGCRGGQLSGLKMVFAILVSQLELRQTDPSSTRPQAGESRNARFFDEFNRVLA